MSHYSLLLLSLYLMFSLSACGSSNSAPADVISSDTQSSAAAEAEIQIDPILISSNQLGIQAIQLDGNVSKLQFKDDLIFNAMAYDINNNLLYAVTLGDLYIVNQQTNVSQQIAVIADNIRIQGMTYDAGTNSLYGIDLTSLYKINPTTGGMTKVGDTGFNRHSALTLNTGDNLLYAINEDQLIQIDPATASGTLIGSSIGFSNINGLTYDPDRSALMGLDLSGKFYQINEMSGTGVEIINPETTTFSSFSMAYNANNRQYILGFRRSVPGLSFPAGNTGIFSFEIIDLNNFSKQFTHTYELSADMQRGITFDPVNHLLYSLSNTAGNETQKLYSIDPVNGIDRLVGDLGLAQGQTLSDITYDRNNERLYGFLAQTGELLRINPADATTTIIGEVTGYSGIGGLAYDAFSGKLYATHNTSPRELLSISTFTAQATKIATLNGDTNRAYYLSFDEVNKTLYGLAYSSSELVQINSNTGEVSSIGAITTGYNDVQGLAYDPTQNTLFGLDVDNNRLVKINTSTGETLAFVRSSPKDISGLAYDDINKIVYGSDTKNGQLISLDLKDGTLAVIGRIGEHSTISNSPYFSPRLNINGLAFNSAQQKLYASGLNRLYIIDPATGNTSSSSNLFGFNQVESLAFDSVNQILYGTDTITDQLLAINIQTGEASAIGPMGFDQVNGLAFDKNSGDLYGVDGNTGRLIQINTQTGVGTSIGINNQYTNTFGLTLM